MTLAAYTSSREGEERHLGNGSYSARGARCSPRAWATGIPLHLLHVLLGLKPVDNRLLVDKRPFYKKER